MPFEVPVLYLDATSYGKISNRRWKILMPIELRVGNEACT
jgi:hypothetical protein